MILTFMGLYYSLVSLFAVVAAGAAVIQHFSLAYELCWKTMKRFIEMEIGLEVASEVYQPTILPTISCWQPIASVVCRITGSLHYDRLYFFVSSGYNRSYYE